MLKKNWKRILIVVCGLALVAVGLVSFVFRPATQPPTATQLTMTAATAQQSVPMATQAAKATPTVQPPTTTATSCILDSFGTAAFGVQLAVDKKPSSDWEFDPTKASRVSGDTTHQELKSDADLAGCPVIIEGRKTLVEEHHIWILEPGSSLYLDPDGIFRAREFSAWAYPSNWNLEDFSTSKAPIAGEFVDAKVNNMLANGYSWPIFVHLSDGTTLQFKPGDKVGAVLPNNCDINVPSKINVTGVFNPVDKTFVASIGAEGCTTAAKIDGKWTTWRNAKDNVVFTTIEAWLMPGTWSQDQVDAWIEQ